MPGFGTRVGRWLREPFCQGFLLLLLLITLFLGKPIFTGQPLLAADLLFEFDPLWQPLAPPGFSAPANQVLSDQVFEFYPWQKFMREEIAQGRLPLWNPYVNSGHPLLANAQSALFDPFHLIAALWPLDKSFVVVAFLRLLCAGTFMLLLALELGLSPLASYLAMIVFTFGGPQIVWLLYPKASVLVWLPAVLYFSLRLIRSGKWHYVVWLGLVMAAQVVGGHPETSFYIVLIWLAFAGYWLWPLRCQHQSLRRSLLQLAVAGLLGFGVSAIQWLPVAEALLQSEILSTRSQATYGWQAIFFAWRDWLAALTMLMPDFFGNPRSHTFWYPYSNYNEQTIFVGLVPLALVLMVVWGRRRGRDTTFSTPFAQRQVAFLTVLWVLSLGFALRLPGFTLIAEVPGLNIVTPGRLRGLYLFVVALLAAYGLDALRQRLSSEQEDERFAWREWRLLVRILWILAIIAALIAGGSYLLVTLWQEQLVELGRAQAEAAQGNPFFFRTLAEYLALAQVRVEQMAAAFHPSNWRMYLPILLALALLAAGELIRLWVRAPWRRAQSISIVVVVFVVGELWLFGIDYNPTIAPEYLYPTPELVDFLLQEEHLQEGDELYRVMGTGITLTPNVGMLFGLEDIRGYDPVAPRRYMDVMGRLPGATRVGHHLLFTNADTSFLDFLNVRYAFATGELSAHWLPLRQNAGVTLYANQEVMPRAFMVYASQLARTPDESLEMTLDPDFDFRRSVILEGGSDPITATLQAASSIAPQVEITRTAPGEMTVQVMTGVPGILVLSEPYTPGWVATVNGAAAEILIANHAFRAVQLPAGNHIVAFRYRPMSFVLGTWISGISLCLLIVILFLSIKPKKA